MSEPGTKTTASSHPDASPAERPHPEDEGVAGVHVPDRPDSIPAARAFLTRLLDGWDVEDDVIEDAALLASELMSNAVKHGAGVVDLKVEADDGLLRVGVHDGGDKTPLVVNEAGPDSAGGRGLWIVQSVAHDWGSDTSGDEPGKTVWFELTLRP